MDSSECPISIFRCTVAPFDYNGISPSTVWKNKTCCEERGASRANVNRSLFSLNVDVHSRAFPELCLLPSTSFIFLPSVSLLALSRVQRPNMAMLPKGSSSKAPETGMDFIATPEPAPQTFQADEDCGVKIVSASSISTSELQFEELI